MCDRFESGPTRFPPILRMHRYMLARFLSPLRELPMAETTPTNGHSSTAVESAASGRGDSFGRSLTNSTGGGALAGVLLGLVFVWIRSRRVRTRICMRTGHDDVKPSHGAGPYHAPESDNHNDNEYRICNVVISYPIFNMILLLIIIYNI